MNRTIVARRGALAAALLVAFALPALADAPEAAAPEKKGWFNRLRHSGEATAAEPQAPAPAPTPSSAAAPAAAPAATPAAAPAPPPAPTPGLEKTLARLRVSPLGKDPQAIPYLDLVEHGTATPPQLNDFAAYVAYRGLVGQAVEIQKAAVKADPSKPTYWVNLGTMHRALREFGDAEGAYRQALDLDPANALAYYNLGTVLDAKEDYDGAVESYRRALILDPKLGDPRVNPQVVGNERMLVVKLLISQTQSGSLALPLVTVQDKDAPKK
jgi:tetratricopeptide (TPR) repeat protein